MTESMIKPAVDAGRLLADALAILDGAGLSLPAAHVEHALQTLRDFGMELPAD